MPYFVHRLSVNKSVDKSVDKFWRIGSPHGLTELMRLCYNYFL